MKYTAINIGPIIATLGMARKPRELWAASYLFSYLMKCIVKVLPQNDIISPATFADTEKNGVGLYPDRVFVKGEVKYESIKPVVEAFAKTAGLPVSYFNVMLVSDVYDKDSAAIKNLNGLLDRMELFNMADEGNSSDKVRDFLIKDNNALLVKDAFTGGFPKETLGEIAAVELKDEVSKDEWDLFKKDLKADDNKVSSDAFKNHLPKDKLKSYHKYICVVQADGDNVGKTVSHSRLGDDKVTVHDISESLLDFGKLAKKAIEDFGGLPIYAGGDDLLFVAPVVGKSGQNILELLEDLNDKSFKGVKDKVRECGLLNPDDYDKPEEQRVPEDNKTPIEASLSFGVSISYYKYPLYEALESARNQLFDRAKHVDGKNAIALDWRKHSGGAFAFEFSKAKDDLKKAFDDMVKASEKKVEESVVSAVAHKIRENEGLLNLWIDNENYEERNDNFFQKYLEYNPDKKNKNESDLYKKTALDLLNKLFENKGNMDSDKLTKTMYGMLRLAKFIKGEEVIDE